MKKIMIVLGIMCMCLGICGCQFRVRMIDNDKIETTEAALDDILKCLRTNDADAMYEMFYPDLVKKEDIQASMEEMLKYIVIEEEYELTRKGLQSTMLDNPKAECIEMVYDVKTGDNVYHLYIGYMFTKDQQGLRGFNLNMDTMPENVKP